jgi:hypothetical protein
MRRKLAASAKQRLLSLSRRTISGLAVFALRHFFDIRGFRISPFPG